MFLCWDAFILFWAAVGGANEIVLMVLALGAIIGSFMTFSKWSKVGIILVVLPVLLALGGFSLGLILDAVKAM